MTSGKKAAGIILLGILVVIIAVGAVYSHFGGFGTGESADPAEFAKFAVPVPELTVPEGTRIIALGEATHGNREFQELKLEVLKVLVEKYGVRALAMEADYGCCEAVNRYIHGGEGTPEEAAAALGFAIYRTQEIADLIDWMRSYNEAAPQEEDLRFYGFDMQRVEYNYQYLLEAMQSAGLETAGLEKLWDGDGLSGDLSADERAAVITDIREKLLEANEGYGAHLAEILLQCNEMSRIYQDSFVNYNGVRDGYMAENVLWILDQEENRGNGKVFITGHNGHIEQLGTYPGGEQKVMGNLLADEIGKDAYFAIGTEFYRTTCNLPTRSGKRVTRSFYSRDPLAKAAMRSELAISLLDYSRIPEDSSLNNYVKGYIYMGSVGEDPMDGLNGLVYRILPQAYRIYRCPSELYDGMIFVEEAHPIEIRD